MTFTSLLERFALAFFLLASLAITPLYARTPDDTLIVAQNIADIITLDPAETFEPTGGEIINNLYVRLITYDAAFRNLEGGVAQSWEVSQDGRTFSFTLRPNLKFHSGNPVRPEDAAFSLRRVVKLGLTPAFILTQYGWTPENVDQKVAVKGGKLILSLNKGWAPTLVLNTLTSGIASVVDEKEVMKHEKNGDLGHAWLRTNAAGSGAFRLKQWKAGEAIVLEAFSAYYKGRPPLQRVIVRHVQEPASQRLLLEKGDVDIARNLLPEHLKDLKGNTDIRIQAETKVSELYLALNQTHKILSIPEVRQALHHLVNYPSISRDLLGGSWVEQQSFIPQGVMGAIGDKPFSFDPDKAKALLKKAGYPNGFEISLNVKNAFPDPQIAQVLQADFAKAGIRLKLDMVDQVQMWARYRKRQHDISLAYWSHDYNDPHSSVDFLLVNSDDGENASNRGASWRTHWKTPPKHLKTIDALTQEKDAAKRAAGYATLQRELLWEAPFVFLVQNNEQNALRRNVKGFVSGPAFDTPTYAFVKK
ncbi:MAG: ABC transporter substrate-binding protein [Zoogloeaceae bacterium]|jgi:peptide/nickel transport system substrate-binding protein|nr:ABC transporter substrate-binding protein [Zoogloeaceae bacterium]